MWTKILLLSLGSSLLLFTSSPKVVVDAKPFPRPDMATAHLSAPNTDIGLERILGMGVVFPYPYYQKPKFRYPVYDHQGRGIPSSYGYGGREIFHYTTFDRREGHH